MFRLGSVRDQREDDLVWPRGVRARLADESDDFIEPCQRGKRLGSRHAGVVGDFIIVDIDAVDALHHVLDHDGVLQASEQDIGDRSEEDVAPVAFNARPDVSRLCSPRLEKLLCHLAKRQHDGAHKSYWCREIVHVVTHIFDSRTIAA